MVTIRLPADSRLTILCRAPNAGRDRNARYEVFCRCTGEIFTVRGDVLKSGAVKSCGCYRADSKVRSNARRGK